MKKKRNNLGFTLIEVVIAMAILAIALTPLIANFIVSSKMNLKSRKNLNTMNLAQDIMEGMRGYPASEVRSKLQNANTADIVGSILPQNTTYTMTDSTATANYTDAVNEYKINDVTLAEGNHNTYDVIVQMIPDTTQYTGEDTARISSIDQSQDAIYTMSAYTEDTESFVLDEFKDRAHSAGVTTTTAALKNYLRREIRLEITKSGSSYSSTVTVVYKIADSQLGTFGLNATTGVYTTVPHNISKAEATKCPSAVYLYYTGLDAATAGYNADMINCNEKISILNQSDSDITVYLVRTQLAGDETKTTKATYNDTYRCRVDIEAKKSDGSGYVDLSTDAADGKVFLVTNVRYDLSHGEKNARSEKEDGTGITVGGTSYYKKERADIYYNSLTTKVNENFFTDKKKEPSSTYPNTYIYNGYRKSDERLLYKVKLLITDKDDNTKILANYEGGTIN